LVEAELRRRIRAQGRITFAEFMEVVLYLPGGGYYATTSRIGRRGDFLTSPETHPIFGALLARLAAFMWRALGSPVPFQIVEYGAGSGSLCRQMLEAAPCLDGDFASALRYLIVEVSGSLRAAQQAELSDLANRVRWADPADANESAVGCVVANELVDALPVHRLKITGAGPEEVYVGLAAGRYLELLGTPSRPELPVYLSDQGVRPPGGSVVEINLAAREWLRKAAGRLHRGYVLVLDYGGAAPDLYRGAGPRGNLRCFSRHGWTDDPYDRPGLQDISAPVDFSDLAGTGERIGLQLVHEFSQANLLSGLGLGEALRWLQTSSLPVEERERNRAAMLALADPRGLGGYRALIQRKAAPAVELTGPALLSVCPPPLLPSRPMTWPE